MARESLGKRIGIPNPNFTSKFRRIATSGNPLNKETAKINLKWFVFFISILILTKNNGKITKPLGTDRIRSESS